MKREKDKVSSLEYSFIYNLTTLHNEYFFKLNIILLYEFQTSTGLPDLLEGLVRKLI